MDLPASHRISVPGGTQGFGRSRVRFAYRGLTLSARPSQTVRLHTRFVTPWAYQLTLPSLSTPMQHRLWTTQSHRFGLFPFRSPLLGESFLFLWVLRCFSSPGSRHLTMCSSQAAQAFPHAGFPIRTSPAVAGAHPSPELNAVYHVLHRQLTPRHPPYALSSLSHM